PLSFLYGIGVSIRNRMFDWGMIRSKSYDVPVISVGNITVGGTGKTPHTEYLIKLLQDELKIAVLSRGYKRKSEGYQLADMDSSATVIGDEPYQIKHKFPHIYIAVDKDRCHGIERLTHDEQTSDVDVILLDDAFQHRYVRPGINILLVDYYRLICDDALLPAGRLREPEEGKSRANIVIITKCPSLIKPMDYRVISKRMELYPYQQLYFSCVKYKELTSVFETSPSNKTSLENLDKSTEVLLLTGIASPKQMQQDLEQYVTTIETVAFGDHHNFKSEDMTLLRKRFEALKGKEKIIITTEKDAARLVQWKELDDELKPFIYYLPIEIEFLQNQQDNFNQNIIGYVRKNKRNSILSEK
ncbi:MAG: tetraacyldisaccharide 4'-kinase, partial [Bacteroidaceae bacterium]